MGERVELSIWRDKLRLKLVKARSGMDTAPRGVIVGLWRHGAERLISFPDAANCRDLREQTKVVLSTLTHHEQQVLRMRFGIGDTGHYTVEEIAQHCALACNRILDIEAQALRKLRHPGGKPLRSVSRV
jgi:Sigma-70, region 4